MFSERRKLLTIFVVSGMIAFCISQPIPGHGQMSRYTVTDLGDLHVEAINDNGQVIGVRSSPQTATFYIWRNGRERKIFTGPGGLLVSGMNNKGQVVGGGEHAFLWENGKMTDLGTLGGRRSLARAINIQGQVVGWSEITGSQTAHAFLWSNGEMKDLGTLPGFVGSNAASINDRGQVVGVVSDLANPQIQRAFLWQEGKMQDLLPIGAAGDWFRLKINNRGQVAGTELGGPDRRRGFIWDAGKIQTLCGTSEIRSLGITACQINDMNDKGQIIGVAVKEVGGALVSFQFVWVKGTMLNLNEAIASDSAWRVSGVVHINNRGQILAGGYLRGNFSNLLLTPGGTP